MAGEGGARVCAESLAHLAPNKALHLTARSVRSCLAPASGIRCAPAFGRRFSSSEGPETGARGSGRAAHPEPAAAQPPVAPRLPVSRGAVYCFLV